MSESIIVFTVISFVIWLFTIEGAKPKTFWKCLIYFFVGGPIAWIVGMAVGLIALAAKFKNWLNN